MNDQSHRSQTTLRNRDPWEDGHTTTPPANIFARDDEYIIELEMPGVNCEGLEISVEGNELTITGRPTTAETPGQLIYSETSGRDFRRCFELSNDVDPNRIRADLNQGLLSLHLPKLEKARPRKINID